MILKLIYELLSLTSPIYPSVYSIANHKITNAQLVHTTMAEHTLASPSLALPSVFSALHASSDLILLAFNSANIAVLGKISFFNTQGVSSDTQKMVSNVNCLANTPMINSVWDIS